MSKMVLPKIVRLGTHKGKRTFTDAKLNDWAVTEAQYDALTVRQQRMVIAADVVSWLDANKIVAKTGEYVRMTQYCDLVRSTQDARTELRKAMGAGAKCHVCAMGATCLAVLDRKNSLQIPTYQNLAHQLNSEARAGEYVDRVGPFTDAQQRVMEACFEKWCNYNPRMINPRRRLRSIMMNLISNEGVFVMHPGAKMHSGERGWSPNKIYTLAGLGRIDKIKW